MVLPLVEQAILPLETLAKKLLSFMMYKEGANPYAYTKKIEFFLWINAETNEIVVMTLFCTTLIDKAQQWTNDYLDICPNCPWKQFKAAFKKHYLELQIYKQVYITVKTLK
jgi:hypothetical protein